MSAEIASSMPSSAWSVDGIHLLDTTPHSPDPLRAQAARDLSRAMADHSEIDAGSQTENHTGEQSAGAPALLCLHGIGSSSRAFSAQMVELGGDHRVVAWDAPGYGDSADPEEPLDLDGYVECIGGIVDRLGGRAHLLGVSFGGVLALASALAHPTRVASLILVGASRGSGRSEGAAIAMLDRVDQLERLGPLAFAEQRAPALVSPDAPAMLVKQVAETMADAVRLPGYRWAAQTMAGTDLTDRLGDVEAPTMVLFGEEDRVTGRAEAEVLTRAIPGAVSVSLIHAGHLANQEQPAATNAWITAFLQIVERLPLAAGPARPR